MEIMNSYLDAPEQHAAACKDPKMLGGPFMDFNRDRSEEVANLLDETSTVQANLIALSMAIRKLEKLLKPHPKGYSLEKLYPQIPDLLKGYVELTYDTNNNIGYRFFEELLYASPFYDEKHQSLALWLTHNDERPFVLSTPRLDEPEVVHLKIPFRSEAIDLLSRMKREAKPYEEIEAQFPLTEEQKPLFRSFFTEEAPAPYPKYTGDKIRMRYFGHACILLETKDISILVDPLISYYGYTSTVEHFSDYDLPETIDYVFITHNHPDHILFETLLPLRHKIKNLVVPRSGGGALQDPKLKLLFKALGFHQVIEMDEMETIQKHDCIMTGIPFTGEHSDLDIKAKLCYHVEIGNFSLLLVADSRILEARLYEHIRKIRGSVDVIFLGMECDGAPLSWLYGPLLPEELSKENDQSRRLSGSDCEKGMSLVNIFNPLEVYVYAMGQEPWCEFISSIKYTAASNPIIQSNNLIEECKAKGIVAERLFGEKEILYTKRINS
jgi:L-ascorbate metabolism protein UlaG (beta-lactamase superfamily)